ncbi:MAG: hypothetical protein ABIC19_01745 [Patescibacteria group bacterium]|nr:hypothetical protein [Patescibacteria group bacterium]
MFSLFRKKQARPDFGLKDKSQEKKKAKTQKKKRLFLVLKILFHIGLTGGLVWSFVSYREAKRQILHLQTFDGRMNLAKEQTKQMLEKVSRHIVIPSDEEPIIADISDPESLVKQESFYENAKRGDKIIVYEKARKAIIYRPDEDKLINVGPIYIEDNENSAVSIQDLEEASLEIRNADKDSSRADELVEELEAIEKFKITGQGEASGEDYQGYTLIDLSNGQKPGAVNFLKQRLETEAAKELPRGEPGSKADVLIIVGERKNE